MSFEDHFKPVLRYTIPENQFSYPASAYKTSLLQSFRDWCQENLEWDYEILSFQGRGFVMVGNELDLILLTTAFGY